MTPILVHRPAEGSESCRIADAAGSTWREMAAALSPIIGRGGFAALYKRSRYLLRVEYPWLAAIDDAVPEPDGFAALHHALIRQPDAIAAAANGALVRTFCDLLTSLIGESLTQQLLGPVLDHPSSGSAAQENAP